MRSFMNSINSCRVRSASTFLRPRSGGGRRGRGGRCGWRCQPTARPRPLQADARRQVPLERLKGILPDGDAIHAQLAHDGAAQRPAHRLNGAAGVSVRPAALPPAAPPRRRTGARPVRCDVARCGCTGCWPAGGPRGLARGGLCSRRGDSLPPGSLSAADAVRPSDGVRGGAAARRRFPGKPPERSTPARSCAPPCAPPAHPLRAGGCPRRPGATGTWPSGPRRWR